jgi:hypothetical protein
MACQMDNPMQVKYQKQGTNNPSHDGFIKFIHWHEECYKPRLQ